MGDSLLQTMYQKFMRDKARFKSPLGKAFKGQCYLEGGYSGVIDASFGVGKDSMFLLSLGLNVHAYERNALIYNEGRERLNDLFSNAPELEKRIVLENKDSKNLGISALKDKSILYFDPMYPSTRNKRKANKYMEAFKEIAGADDDWCEALEAYFQLPLEKIILKRPLKAEKHPKTSYQLKGKTIRYDIFILNGLKGSV